MRKLISILAAALTLSLFPSSALAQYPGTNSKIYFVSANHLDIQRSNPDGTGQETVLSAVSPRSVPVVSKDGTKIVYEADAGIFVVNVDGTGNHKVPNTANGDYDPVWSPDGTKIYFDVSTDIMVIDANGASRSTLLAGDETIGYYEPTVSPDGSMLAFLGYNRETQFTDVYKMSSTGGTVTNVTQNADREGDTRNAVWVDWSPDGTQFAVASTYIGEEITAESYVDKISVSGGAYANVLTTPLVEGQPYYTQVNWSPDGLKMVVTKQTYTEGSVFVGLETVNSDGTDDPDLTALGAVGDAWWSIPQPVTPGLPDVGAVK